jgi:hypothetical protein
MGTYGLPFFLYESSFPEMDNGLPYLNWTEHPNNPM